MALRRGKQTAATLAAVPTTAPAPSRPPFGYDAATVAEAAEVLRHQAVVLGVRARVAGAAGGRAPAAVAAAVPAPAVPTQPDRDLEPVLAALREAVELGARADDLRRREEAHDDLERERARTHEDRVAELDRDAAALRTRKEELDARAKELDRSGSTRERHVAELDRRVRKVAADEQSLRATQIRLEEWERDLELRDVEIGRRGDELRRAEKKLRKTREALEKTQRRIAAADHKRPGPTAAPPEPVQPADAAPVATPEPPDPVAAGAAAQNVETLAALVTRYAGEFPEQVEEWRWYLQSLRDVADISGALPLSVDGLVHDVFGPLLARAARD